MRHIDRGDANLALQALELAAHLVAQLRIEVRERLVEEKQSRLVHDRARERHPLLLAAGQPCRRTLLKTIQIDNRKRPPHAIRSDMIDIKLRLKGAFPPGFDSPRKYNPLEAPLMSDTIQSMLRALER